ncbi:MAG: DUF4136 domain-containing protein [Sphingomonadaceae bacterium]
MAGRGFPGGLVLVACLVLLLVLSGCASPFRAQVSRFQVLPPPSGETFAIVPADERNLGGLEFRVYAQAVQQAMERQGYRLASDPAAAQLVVRMGYGVGAPRERVDTRPGAWGAWGPGWGGWGWGGWAWGGRGWYGRPWGWYDPWWGWGGWGGWGGEVYSYTVYPSFLELTISRAADGVPLFEGRAQSTTRNNDLTFLVPRLVEALFTGFPGNSGETVNVRLPEQRS